MTKLACALFCLFAGTLLSAQEEFMIALPDSQFVTLRSFDSSAMAAYLADPDFDYRQAVGKKPVWKVWWDWVKQQWREWFLSPASVAGRIWRIALLLIVVAFMAYYFSRVRFSGIFRRQDKADGSGVEIFREEVDVETLDHRIAESITRKDYRSAYRLMYLQLLTHLGDRGVVKLHKYKTNRDYLREMQGSAIAGDFQELARTFDYIWYGGYPLDDVRFGALKEKMDLMKKGEPV